MRIHLAVEDVVATIMSIVGEADWGIKSIFDYAFNTIFRDMSKPLLIGSLLFGGQFSQPIICLRGYF